MRAAQDKPRRTDDAVAARPDDPSSRHAEVGPDDDPTLELQDEVLAVRAHRRQAPAVDVLGDARRAAPRVRRRRLDGLADEGLQLGFRTVDGVALGHAGHTVPVVPTRELPAGASMPVLGLGVWQMAAGAETEQAVTWALEAGYRHIDTASMYRNEKSVGDAIRRFGVPREEVFVTTKLVPKYPNAGPELERSLERLGFDYVDLYLIHWPVPVLRNRHWRQLASLQEQGLTREIGVSNYSLKHLEGMRRKGLRTPAVNQVHFSPLRYQPDLLEYCDAHGIVLEAYSPLERGRGLDHPTVRAIAERVGRTPAQVMIRWALQKNTVVIPKSSREERIRSNAQVFDFELGSDDMRLLDALRA
jgi:diketogulonate reductase-like aldo/keto reductase